MKIHYDLHIHSCLSPCGEEEMTPNNIVNMAALAGFEAIALTDHNTCRNCGAVIESGRGHGLVVLPGMELTTSEEVHVVCLFEALEAALAFSDYVYARLPDIKNAEEIFGAQLLMDAEDRVCGREERLLINATGIGIYEVPALVASYGGFAFPAHIDRSSNSVLANLGLWDEGMGFALAEISPSGDPDQLREVHPALRQVAFIRNCDAHRLEAIPDAGAYLEVDEKTPAGVLRALRALRV